MTTNKLAAKHVFFKKNAILDILYSLCLVAIMIVLLCNPKQYNKSVLDGISLFAMCVLPGLFPFMILTRLLTGIGGVQKLSKLFEKPAGALFGTSGISSYVFLMSAISGYPIGAKIIADLYCQGAISQHDAKKMSVFCTTSGPIFVIGTVGTILFKSAKVGIIIYASHILASIMSGITLRGKHKKQSDCAPAVASAKVDNLIASTVSDSVQNILIVGAYITIFFLFADILFQTGLIKIVCYPFDMLFSCFGLQNLSTGFVFGLLEVTRGAKMLSTHANMWSVCLCAALVSFSGLSIIMQSMNYLSKCKIKARSFVFSKCVHALYTFVICFALCKLFAVS